MSIGERHTDIPLYVWINQCNGVLNITAESRLHSLVTGASITEEVMLRYFRLYKIPVYRAMDIVYQLIHRYRTKIRFVQGLEEINNCIGIVSVGQHEYGHQILKATKAELAHRYMRNKLAKIKKLPAGEALDLLVARMELEGVLRYQLPEQQRRKKVEAQEAKRLAYSNQYEERKREARERRSLRAKQMWANRAQLKGELK